ncbi:MAG: monofunctional biosynthetic peptidoglycan transglycosylase [Candidatus Eisenbacteria bacterium]|nr:monofunctional biosynthetic peptidoglycan transglycosylase [Candidatus Eisenbacteria bacterium]
MKSGSFWRQKPLWWAYRIAMGLAVLLVVMPSLYLGIHRWIPIPMTSFMIQDRLHARFAGEQDYIFRYEWTPWHQISPHAGIAVVAAEDQKFPWHSGFDVEAIEEAWEDHQKGGRPRGASTISQQVAKNLFLWPGRNFVRKGFEATFTILIEFFWPKKRILEVYLNTAEMGRGVFGVGAAARLYFNKSPGNLTAHESALLAAVLPNPIRLRADRPSAYVNRRAEWIQKQMRQLGGAYYLSGI